MFTKLIEGVAPLPNDKALQAIVKKESDPWNPTVPGGRFRIGIANADGAVYRTIEGDDWGEFVHTHMALSRVLRDRFPVGDTRVDGFDAILEPSQRKRPHDSSPKPVKG